MAVSLPAAGNPPARPFAGRTASTTDWPDAIDRMAPWLACAYALVTFAWYVIWKANMAERSGDEPLFENMLWNAAHGFGLRTWLEGGTHHLAVHFSPVLYLFVPLYAWFGSMHPVHLAVSITTAAAGLVFFRLARRALEPMVAMLLMTAFLLHPTIILQTFMEFHEQALAPLPLLLLIGAIASGSSLAAGASTVALLSLREDNIVVVLALAAIAFLRGRRRMALLMTGVGAVWMVMVWQIGIVRLGGGALAPAFAGTYGQWGATPSAMLRGLVTHPVQVVRHLLSGAPLRYAIQLTAPLLGIAAFGDLTALAALPSLILNMLAAPGSRPLEMRMHFSIVPVVVMYAGMIGVVARLSPRLAAVRARVRTWRFDRVLAGVLLVLSIATVPMWLVRSVDRLNPYTRQARAMLATIPDTASVTAPSYLLAELTHRRWLAFDWGDDRMSTEVVIMEDASRRFYQGTTVEGLYSLPRAARLQRSGYTQVDSTNGWHVWRRSGSVLTTAAARPAGHVLRD